MRPVLATVLAALLGLHASPAAQCTDPLRPPGGYGGYVEINNVFQSFTDGYLTVMDFRHPSVPAGPCGWPLMILVPTGGQDKSSIGQLGIRYANLGYATVIYDPRGSGSYATLNDPLVYPRSLVGLRDRFDVFEVMEFAEATWPALIDFNRIGVTGSSLGGRYSWWVAAHSGKTPPANPWRTAPFPAVTCVIPEHFTADFNDLWVPEGRAVHPFQFRQVFQIASSLAPAEALALTTPLLNEDYPGFMAALNPPGLYLPPLLATSTVPWAATLSYDDLILSARDGILGTWAGTPAGVAKRINYSTGSHGAPRNDKEILEKLDNRVRWMDRWMKGIQNGIDTEPAVRFPTTPEDAVDYNDTTYLWGEACFSEPDPTLPMTRWYLDGGNALSATAPVAGSSSDALVHNSSIDVLTYSQLLPGPQLLMSTYMPLASIPFDSPALTADAHMVGPADMRIIADSAQTRYQVHGALYDVDAAGNERFVCDGFTTVRDNLPAGTNTLDFSTYVQSYVFRAGHKIRLRIENLTLFQPPTVAPFQMRAVPVFESSTVQILHEVANASYIELPIAAAGPPTTVGSVLELSDAKLDNVEYAIHTSSADGGFLYLFLLGLSGTNPGLDVGGVHLALNPDTLTTAALAAPSTAPFSALVGTLDSTGFATGQLQLAPFVSLGLSGATLSAVSVSVDPLTAFATASPALDIPIGP